MDWWRTQHGQHIRRYIGIIGLELVIIMVLVAVNNRPERETAEPEATATYEPLVLYATVDAHATDAEPVTTYYDVPLSEDVQDELFALCEEYDLDPSLVLAIIEVESGFDADVISSTDDYGLMQINSSNFEWLAEELGIIDFLEPTQNLRAGCYILYQCLQMTDGETDKALMIYNMGLSAASEAWELGVTGTSYTRAVLEVMEDYA
ncbi:MAG: transglycosylase SLT domain-containing protein [Oscillospiraceae bacterium]|nr:transglycosylase SLT domain-containing protein [Oscillospiraceae bacterium]